MDTGDKTAAYDRLKWRVLRSFGALPSEARVKAMKEEDYLWCARNLVLDGKEALSRLCPACRQKALEEGSCPVCGAAGGDQGVNEGFDMERFQRLRGADTAHPAGGAPGREAGRGDELQAGQPMGREERPEELVQALRRVQAGEEFVRSRQHQAVTVTLPEASALQAGWSMEDLDRAVERDARRYDGGSSLY